MDSLLQAILDWVTLHPVLAGLVVFLIALLESLIVIGLLIPGAFLLFGAGALIATGNLPLVPIMLWTIAGAIAGDTISFLIGRHYHQRLRVMWPLRRYPAMVNRGTDFFFRHGGKSVFMARFVGPVRPVIPAIAGMMEMPVARFLAVDIVASILWAPAYILPGMVFGASLGLAAEVAGRLVVLLVVIAGITWLCIELMRGITRLLQPPASALLDRLLLTEKRIAGLAADTRKVAALPDPVGEVVSCRMVAVDVIAHVAKRLVELLQGPNLLAVPQPEDL